MTSRDMRPSRAGGQPRLIIGVSGASGAVYAIRLLEVVGAMGYETHLIISKPAMMTIAEETGRTLQDVTRLAAFHHDMRDIGAGPASGSFRALGMIIAPCSMRSVAEIASGATASLLTRAADVTLKERRPLVLAARETPLHLGHLRSMTAVAEIGAIIAPPMPAFYIRPRGLEAMINHQVGRWLDLLGIDNDLAHRWREPVAQGPSLETVKP